MKVDNPSIEQGEDAKDLPYKVDIQTFSETRPKPKEYQGGTFGPGMQFDELNVFIGCTFYAQCQFGERCIFINCNFVKCCPSYYTNPWSVVGSGSILENCSLEYVTIPNDCILKSPTIVQATVQSPIDPPGRIFGYNGEGRTVGIDRWNVLTPDGWLSQEESKYPRLDDPLGAGSDYEDFTDGDAVHDYAP